MDGETDTTHELPLSYTALSSPSIEGDTPPLAVSFTSVALVINSLMGLLGTHLSQEGRVALWPVAHCPGWAIATVGLKRVLTGLYEVNQ